MSEDLAKAGVGSAQPTKKARRGVSNKTQAVAQLRFHEKDAAQNGLFIGHLDEVRVDWSNNEDAKSFAGMNVPRLTLHFASNHANASEKRHVYQTLFPVESNVDTIPGGKDEWKVNNTFNWIKHILDVFYLKGREMTAAEEDALSLTFEDYDENGAYVAIEPEEVIEGYRTIFENAAAMLNGSFQLGDGETAKPVYKDANGKFIPCWLKLLRHKKRKGDWINVGQNGELAFDSFIGSGVVELVKKDCPPVIIRLDLAKESITPKETKKVPTIGAPGMGMPSMGGVIPTGSITEMPGDMGAFAAAGEETPF